MSTNRKFESCMNIKKLLAIYHRDLIDTLTYEKGAKAISEINWIKNEIKNLERNFKTIKCRGDIEFTRPFPPMSYRKVGGTMKKRKNKKKSKIFKK